MDARAWLAYGLTGQDVRGYPTLGAPDPRFREAFAGMRAGDRWSSCRDRIALDGADPRQYVEALFEAGGPRQLVWASDWPFVGLEDTITYGMCIDWLYE